MVKNGSMKKNKKNSFLTFKKLTYKKRRMLYGLVMFYSFIVLAHMIYVLGRVVAIGGLSVFSQLALWFFPPLALILLTYHLLVNVYPPEEKNV